MNALHCDHRALLLIGSLLWGASLNAESPKTGVNWTTQQEIFVPMRDGARLSTDVSIPTGTSDRLPTVLVRTPYDKDSGEPALASWLRLFLEHGFAVVVQSERGRYFSEGEYRDYLEGARTDGFDTIDWITHQSWSNGRVGTFGCSSSADNEWPTAAAGHPAHRALVAGGTWAVGDVSGNETRGAFYRGGVPMSGLWAPWYHDLAPRERLMLPQDSTQDQRVRLRATYSLQPRAMLFDSADPEGVDLAKMRHLPTQDLLKSLGGAQSAFDEYLTWGPADSQWSRVALVDATMRPRVPSLLLSTWHDAAVGETTRLFAYLQQLKVPDQHLVIAPGPHCSVFLEDWPPERLHQLFPNLSTQNLEAVSNLSGLKFGDLNIGDARLWGREHGYAHLFLDWFDAQLRDHRARPLPNVQVFIMGYGWLKGDVWPLAGTHTVDYYLGAGVAAETSVAGTLTRERPAREAFDHYTYDPDLPTPSVGGGCCEMGAARDQRAVQERADVLVYRSPPLKHSVTVIGAVEVELYVGSSAPDTDFMVKFLDIYPDGREINLADDAFRVRYREGFDRKAMMVPDQIYRIQLPNMVTGIRFPPGHRIGLQIASSDFPLYDRNLNSGGNNYDEDHGVIAQNRIYRGGRYSSRVRLSEIADPVKTRERAP